MEEDPPSIKHSTYLQVLAKHYAGAKKFTSVVPRPYKGQQRAQATAYSRGHFDIKVQRSNIPQT